MEHERCDTCQDHSGMVSRNTLLIWMLGILIVIGGTQTTLLMNVKEQIAGFAYRFTVAEQSRQELKVELTELKRRVSQLERFEIINKEPRH